MKLVWIAALGYGLYYVFGYVIDPATVPIEGWIVTAGITGVLFVTGANGSLWRLAKWALSSNSPRRVEHQQTARPAPAPAAPATVGDYIKLKLADAKENLLQTQAEETRKTAEARRQALADKAARQAATRRPEPEPIEVLPPLTLREAIARSTDRAWIVGQESARQGDDKHRPAGRLLTFDYQVNHVAIVGATGTGKTEGSAELLVYYARKYGLHVIVLDGKRGLDWERFDGAVEWHSSTIETIGSQIDQLFAIFLRRWDQMRAAQVNKIYDLPKRPRTLFVVFEEFGQLWQKIKQDKELYTRMADQIDDLFRLGRAAGIVICLMDQAPEDWSRQMRANAKFVICYKLGAGAGNTFSEYYAGKLPDKAVYSQSNVFYNAWHFDAELDLKRVCPPIVRRFLANVEPVRRPDPEPGERSQVRSYTGEPGEPEKVGGIEPVKMAQNDPPPPSEFVRMYERSRTWDEVARAYFAQQPGARQVDLTQLMARIVGDGRRPEAFKSEANRVYHLYSPRGKQYQGEVLQ